MIGNDLSGYACVKRVATGQSDECGITRNQGGICDDNRVAPKCSVEFIYNSPGFSRVSRGEIDYSGVALDE